MATPGPARPVLDLGSLDPERSKVRIDGVEYRYRADMDLNLVDLARIERVRERVDQLAREAEEHPSPQSDPERAQAVSGLLVEGVRLVMYDPIPDGVMAKLNDVQRLAIIDDFTRATLRAALPRSSKARMELQKAIRMSLGSSRASSASTRRRASRSG